MLAAGDQADKVACQAEACDLAPSVRQQLEQPQSPDRHIVDVPHGVAFTEQRTARPERHDRDDRLEMRELVLAKRGEEDRKRVGQGKSEYVREDLGGGQISQQTKK